MRIIAGTVGGRRIDAPAGADVRPTTDRVREALFSSLGHRVAGAAVLDLFAGSGALGLESLSRGAGYATFVERGRGALLTLRRNISSLGLGDRCAVVAGDALTFLKNHPSARFDLIFLDPPYDGTLLGDALEWIARRDLLAEDGWILAEHRESSPVPPPDNLQVIRQRKYGSTCITFIGRRAAPSPG
jgi:16S rRNA (guanine(966)-N(2))-methyltransferase RsmD